MTLGGGGAQVYANSGTLNLTATGAGSDTINLYTGAATIGAGGTTNLLVNGGSGSLNFVGGAGSSTILGGAGNDTLFGGSGSASFTGGGGANLFEFTKLAGAGTGTITDFGNASTPNTLILIGYGVTAGTNALATAQLSGTTVTLTLSDNTKITFLNETVANLTGHITSI